MFFNTILATASIAGLAVAAPFPSGDVAAVSRALKAYISHGPNYQPNRTEPAGARVLEAGETVTSSVAVTSINDNDGIGGGTDSYTMYWGDGSAAAGWPSIDQWVSFEDMFNNNKVVMRTSCEGIQDHYGNSVSDDSEDEIGKIWDAIEQVAQETFVDHRFILATIMQESGGCVRVSTTNYGVRNPGLMQDHDGDATCNSDIAPYTVQTPCPPDVITQMVRDGTAGTASGDGLANCINQSGASDASAFYKAARIYNSGSIAASGNLQDGIATHCYSSDIANRLTGWVQAPHGCTLDG
ncbi:hypothetical protein PMAA_009950 [Paecilomyces variotii No. 5]|uniref:Muramidase n=1 Tax=Byssochlamys spectabilis (strain No. 5 / NBRC 109023) TaxID=1356009 RepID=V5FLR1_BYSSN|nr:hypothetical protein PMAA_009950 [Paecilomyces variotii No. 5]